MVFGSSIIFLNRLLKKQPNDDDDDKNNSDWKGSGIRGVESRIQDYLGFSYMGRLFGLPQFWVKIDRTLRSGRRSRRRLRFPAEVTSS